MSEQFTFFWNGPFSQWYSSSFEIDGIRFITAEQFMMYSKAILFKDEDIAYKIMKSADPMEQKALGRKVKNFNIETWSDAVGPRLPIAWSIVRKGSWNKFSQNPDLLKVLAATAGTTLVEASPDDKIWGIGLGEWDDRKFYRKNWQGTNWLGEILTNVRLDLCGK
jgi:ribA/ribD-fused uncharacterized protein